MRKALFLFMVFGLVGLMCGCEVGTTALSESDISDDYNEEVKKSLRKLILTGNCKECPFVGVDISGKDLNGINKNFKTKYSLKENNKLIINYYICQNHEHILHYRYHALFVLHALPNIENLDQYDDQNFY